MLDGNITAEFYGDTDEVFKLFSEKLINFFGKRRVWFKEPTQLDGVKTQLVFFSKYHSLGGHIIYMYAIINSCKDTTLISISKVIERARRDLFYKTAERNTFEEVHSLIQEVTETLKE